MTAKLTQWLVSRLPAGGVAIVPAIVPAIVLNNIIVFSSLFIIIQAAGSWLAERSADAAVFVHYCIMQLIVRPRWS